MAAKPVVVVCRGPEGDKFTRCAVAALGGELTVSTHHEWASIETVLCEIHDPKEHSSGEQMAYAHRDIATSKEHLVWAELRPSGAAVAEKHSIALRLGHQQASAVFNTCPPASDDQIKDATRAPPHTFELLPRSSLCHAPPLAIRLAACAVVIDPVHHAVLLTRRPKTMRTFPRAWVTPGGAVDCTDASLASAALRELFEETGIRGTDPRPLCAWESAFPVTAAQWRDACDAGRRTSQILVVFFVVHGAIDTPITLQPDECDAACWVPIADFIEVNPGKDLAYPQALGVVSENASIPAKLILGGIYPTADGEGVGRGHMFALSQLVAQTYPANSL